VSVPMVRADSPAGVNETVVRDMVELEFVSAGGPRLVCVSVGYWEFGWDVIVRETKVRTEKAVETEAGLCAG